MHKAFISIVKRHYFVIIIACFLLYSAVLIFRSSFVVDGVRYFALFDDTMISMRYAYNLAHGYGLVWNPGAEPVEGYTNPLWTLYMAVVHLLPIPLAKTSLVIQITSALCMAATLYFVKRLAEIISNRSSFTTLWSVLFTAFYFPLLTWTVVLGTEVTVLTLLVTWAAFIAAKVLKNHQFSVFLFVLLGVGILVRMDFLVLAIIITGWLVIFDSKNRKKHLLVGVPIVVSAIAILSVFRLWYYHELLPNTYYLKLTGYPLLKRFTRGVYVSLHALNVVVLFIPLAYTLLTRNRYMVLLVGLVAAQFLYNIYVGGDSWEWQGGPNRYLSVVMPVLFVAIITTFNAAREQMHKHARKLWDRYRLCEGLALGLLFLIFNTAANNTLFQMLLISRPYLSLEPMGRVEWANRLREITKPDAKIAIALAGTTPYFLPDRYFVDTLGKNDKVIAREPAHESNVGAENRLEQYIGGFYPGHNKYDYRYVVEEYRPDIFVDFWQLYGEKNETYLARDYIKMTTMEGYSVFVLKKTPHVEVKKLKPTRD